MNPSKEERVLRAPAGRFGESQQLGRIAPGFDADLVVLGGDPSKDVRAFGVVRYTIRNGKAIYRVTGTRCRCAEACEE